MSRGSRDPAGRNVAESPAVSPAMASVPTGSTPRPSSRRSGTLGFHGYQMLLMLCRGCGQLAQQCGAADALAVLVRDRRHVAEGD